MHAKVHCKVKINLVWFRVNSGEILLLL